MFSKSSELRVFLREFRETYHSTGAVLPSGRSLAAALARYVRSDTQNGSGGRRILEVGPGTGAVTRAILRAMGPEDHLELVELNDRFVVHLKKKLDSDSDFQTAAARVTLTHGPVQDVAADEPFDLIVSCLPLNNFPTTLVEEILAKLRALLRHGGTLSFFEYIAIRRAKAIVSRQDERQRLRKIGQLIGDTLEKHEIHCDRVLANVPPAWVHHVRF